MGVSKQHNLLCHVGDVMRCNLTMQPPLFKLHGGRQKVYAMVPHHGDFRAAVLNYKLRQQMSGVWNILLSRSAALKILLSHVDVLVPIPNSTLRVHFYGFSPSLGLAQMLRSFHGICIERKALKMVRGMRQAKAYDSYSQKVNCLTTWLQVDKRLSHLEGKRVLLIDDVYNSGATLSVAQKLCSQVNPRCIRALVVAYTHRHGIHFTPCDFGYQWPDWPADMARSQTHVSEYAGTGCVSPSG